MTLWVDVESAKPLAPFEVLRPPALGGAGRTTGEGVTWLRISLQTQPDVFLLVTPGLGTQPRTPLGIISNESTEPADWPEYQHPWAPKGAAEFLVTKQIDWPRIELDY